MRIKEIAGEVAYRIGDCRACEMPLLKMSLDHDISSETVRNVIDQTKMYFQDRKDALYRLQQKLQAENAFGNEAGETYTPGSADIDATLLETLYKNTLVKIVTSNATQDPFWRIEDDLQHVNVILHQPELKVPDLLESAGGLRKSYVKCENCGQLLFETSTGKLFPYCSSCYHRKEA